MEGQRLRELPIKINKIVKVTDSLQSPILYVFIDVCSEEKNRTLTFGGMGVLEGKLLSFNAKDDQLELFFVPVNDQKNKIRVKVYSGVRPSEIHFQIPELEAGEYKLIALTLSRSGKKILNGELEETLRVR